MCQPQTEPWKVPDGATWCQEVVGPSHIHLESSWDSCTVPGPGRMFAPRVNVSLWLGPFVAWRVHRAVCVPVPNLSSLALSPSEPSLPQTHTHTHTHTHIPTQPSVLRAPTPQGRKRLRAIAALLSFRNSQKEKTDED